jgi:hypothetical protein
VDEFERIIFWVWRIGDSEKTLVELSRNAATAKEALELLKKYSLVVVRKKGRIYLVSLSEKGLNVYRKLGELREFLGIPVPSERREQPAITESQGASTGLESVPTFVADNPWLKVLAQRGRERVGL